MMTFRPAYDLEKHSFSKCSLHKQEFLLTGVFSRLILTSQVARSFLLFSGSECHERCLQCGLSLRLLHPNATQCLTIAIFAHRKSYASPFGIYSNTFKKIYKSLDPSASIPCVFKQNRWSAGSDLISAITRFSRYKLAACDCRKRLMKCCRIWKHVLRQW